MRWSSPALSLSTLPEGSPWRRPGRERYSRRKNLSPWRKGELKEINKKLETYQARLQSIIREVPQWRRELIQGLRDLNVRSPRTR